MSGYYSDEDDIDIHVARRRAPSPMHYVEARDRPRSYYPQGGSSYLVAERTVTRARSRDRSRERRSSPPTQAPAPVIINKIYNDISSDEDDNRRLQVASRSGHRSRSRSGSSSYMTREEYEAERARRELEEMKLVQRHEKEERRTAKELREEAELKRAKQELDDIKRENAREEEEKRIKRELELKRLRDEEREDQEKKRRDKEAKEAVELYKQKERERLDKEKAEKEFREKEYQRRLQEDLIKSGLDEKQIAAIMKKEKVPEAREDAVGRPTYTRMARRHLSIETLRSFHVEYELDADPEYVLIKRWVPEWEQDTLWKHTKYLREKRSKLILSIDDGKKHHHHHHKESDFEWVRKKSDRKRSKSPALLMYLAGAKPA